NEQINFTNGMHSPTDFDDFDDSDDSDTTNIPFGGRLKHYSDEWLNNFGHQNATKFVQRGYYPKWDSYPPPLSVPPISRQKVISNFYTMRQRYIEIRTLTSLISKLHNIVRDSEYTKELRRDKNSHQGRNPHSNIQLSREGRQELKYWIDNIEELNGYPINST
ncbi:23208_t:CDS:2, partial [Racocetra persica]